MYHPAQQESLPVLGGGMLRGRSVRGLKVLDLAEEVEKVARSKFSASSLGEDISRHQARVSWVTYQYHTAG